MIFFNWEIIGVYAVLLAILLASGGVIRAARKWRKSLRVTATILSWPFAVLAILLLGLELLLPSSSETNSAPMYSPDHLKAAMVRTYDYGATGGDSMVEIFSGHGFSSTEVYWGEWGSVSTEDIHWAGDRELVITHDEPMYQCGSTATVTVRCERRPQATAPSSR
jgi:hypothetical protein